MTESTVKARSPFNECLILVTICGRSLLRRQQHNISQAYGDVASDWTQHRGWLDNILSTRLQVLTDCYPSPAESYDPLLLLANILSQATVVYYCNNMLESASGLTDPAEASADVVECQHRALAAATNMINLGKTLCGLHFSKVSQWSSDHDTA